MVGFLAIDQQVCMCVWFKAPQYQTIPLDHWCCPFQERLSNLVLKRMKIWSFQIAKKKKKKQSLMGAEHQKQRFLCFVYSAFLQSLSPLYQNLAHRKSAKFLAYLQLCRLHDTDMSWDFARKGWTWTSWNLHNFLSYGTWHEHRKLEIIRKLEIATHGNLIHQNFINWIFERRTFGR